MILQVGELVLFLNQRFQALMANLNHFRKFSKFWCLSYTHLRQIKLGSFEVGISYYFFNGSHVISIHQSVSSVDQSCLTLYEPMNRSTSGLPVHHQPTPGVYSNSHPSSRWHHPVISSSVVPFSSHFQSFPASVLRIRWPKYWSFSFSVSPSIEYLGLISFRID